MAKIAVKSEAELVEAVRAARDGQHRLDIIGSGSKSGLGRPPAGEDVLELSALRGIILYEPEELVLTARAGTPLAEIEAAIAPKNQRLGFDPADWGPLFGAPARAGTIAGAFAADTSGSARIRYGAARDHLLGFRAVNGFGDAYKGGGRVVKNVTGFDLSKLMCGALGTLGPMSEVTLRLVPRPPLAITLALKDVTPERGLALLRRVWASPLEATGLAFIPACADQSFARLSGIGAGAVLVRIEGAAEPLAEKRTALAAMLDGRDVVEVPQGDGLFAHIGAGGAFVDRSMDVWRIAVPPTEAAATAQALAGTIWYADWAGSLFWVGTSGTDDASVRRLRQIAARAGGHATLLRAAAETRARHSVFPPEGEALAGLTRAVKSAFDPSGLFNHGRMFEGV